jgi:hypothetical protein
MVQNAGRVETESRKGFDEVEGDVDWDEGRRRSRSRLGAGPMDPI